jgi:hypothetical protein
MRTLVISGFIKLIEAEDLEYDLYIDDLNLLEEITNDYGIVHCESSVKYFISDKECTLEEAQNLICNSINGTLDTQYNINWSETSDYLYTDRKFNIGGHDILKELSSYEGKFVILIIDYERR